MQQSLEDTCGLASVAVVVGEVIGNAPTEEQIIKLAQNTPSVIRDGPIYLPTGDPGHESAKGGIDMADTVVLLEHYGIKSHMTYDAHPEEVGLPMLEQYLGAGRKVIAWVNSGTILGSDDQRTAPDHLLVVTGVDTNNETVHLNDPYADHADTKVSIGKIHDCLENRAGIDRRYRARQLTAIDRTTVWAGVVLLESGDGFVDTAGVTTDDPVDEAGRFVEILRAG